MFSKKNFWERERVIWFFSSREGRRGCFEGLFPRGCFLVRMREGRIGVLGEWEVEGEVGSVSFFSKKWGRGDIFMEKGERYCRGRRCWGGVFFFGRLTFLRYSFFSIFSCFSFFVIFSFFHFVHFANVFNFPQLCVFFFF